MPKPLKCDPTARKAEEERGSSSREFPKDVDEWEEWAIQNAEYFRVVDFDLTHLPLCYKGKWSIEGDFKTLVEAQDAAAPGLRRLIYAIVKRSSTTFSIPLSEKNHVRRR